MSPRFSVVIPTWNREDSLRRVLFALARQQDAPPFEVIVVDDGSTDGTPGLLARACGLPLRTLRQPNRGPAAARNRGVAAAQGALVAFLGDDTVPEPGWLATHAEAHAGLGPTDAVLGRVDWPLAPPPSAFLHYINEYGAQFGFALIDDPEEVPFNFLYTSNLSLPRTLLGEEPFDVSFPHAAWEDVELAWRLKKRGLRLRYRPGARVIHHHPTSLQSFLARMERVGEAGARFAELHPELEGFLGLPLRPRRDALLAPLCALAVAVCARLEPLPWALPGVWEGLIRHAYRRGLGRGLR